VFVDHPSSFWWFWSIPKALQLLLIYVQDECLANCLPFVYLLSTHPHSGSSGQSLKL
jgi:hypothetical protein